MFTRGYIICRSTLEPFKLSLNSGSPQGDFKNIAPHCSIKAVKTAATTTTTTSTTSTYDMFVFVRTWSGETLFETRNITRIVDVTHEPSRTSLQPQAAHRVNSIIRFGGSGDRSRTIPSCTQTWLGNPLKLKVFLGKHSIWHGSAHLQPPKP